MTLSHFSARLGALAAASALSATLVFVAPQAHAASNGSYYKIELAQPTAAKPALSLCPSRCAARHHLCLDHAAPRCYEPDPYHTGLFICRRHSTKAAWPMDIDRALRLHFLAHADPWSEGNAISL